VFFKLLDAIRKYRQKLIAEGFKSIGLFLCVLFNTANKFSEPVSPLQKFPYTSFLKDIDSFFAT